MKHFLSVFLSTVPTGGVTSAAPSPGILLNINDLARVYPMVKQDAANWYNTGLHLRFGVGELDAIQGMPLLIVKGVEAYQEELLKRWLKRVNPPPYLQNLADAIYQAGNQRLGVELVPEWQRS